jgi:hypothetical protein
LLFLIVLYIVESKHMDTFVFDTHDTVKGWFYTQSATEQVFLSRNIVTYPDVDTFSFTYRMIQLMNFMHMMLLPTLVLFSIMNTRVKTPPY